MLALAKVQNGHDCSLLVLRRVALEQLGDDGLILWREFEGNIGVVIGGVAMLWLNKLASSCHSELTEAGEETKEALVCEEKDVSGQSIVACSRAGGH